MNDFLYGKISRRDFPIETYLQFFDSFVNATNLNKDSSRYDNHVRTTGNKSLTVFSKIYLCYVIDRSNYFRQTLQTNYDYFFN